MHIFHNSQDIVYRRPFGAAPCGSSVTLSVDVTDLLPDSRVFFDYDLRNEHVSIEMIRSSMVTPGTYRYSCETILPDIPGIIWYFFRVETLEGIYYYGNNMQRLGGVGEGYIADPVPYQITVYVPDYVPRWYKEAVVYQIFPDRFARSDDWEEMQKKAEAAYGDCGACEEMRKRPLRKVASSWDTVPNYPRNADGGVSEWIFSGGNLKGIRKKLGYLRELGVTCIYLNPIFMAASNHKYDTANYMHIDEAFGTDEDFSELCSAAGEMGISMILDGVFSHTGYDSIYFNRFGRFKGAGAWQGQESPYYDWYTFTNNGYECWWGVPDLPNVVEMTSGYREYIYGSKDSVIRKWMKLGAKGWRLDVADELPDEFIQGIRASMKAQDPDSLLLGEVWEDASNKESYGRLRQYFWGNELQSVMNYPFRTAVLDYIKGRITAGDMAARLMSLSENYPKENFYACLNLIGSHDRVRILTELADAPEAVKWRLEDESCWLSEDESRLTASGISRYDAIKECFTIPDDKKWMAKSRLKAVSMMQFVMPGVPCIYYGDEAGMQGFEDPYNRGTYPWGREDEELLSHYRFLGHLRKDYPVLVDGSFRAFALSDHVICIERGNASEHMWLIVNRGIFEWETVELAPLTQHSGGAEGAAALSGAAGTIINAITGETIAGDAITLEPLAYLLLRSYDH